MGFIVGQGTERGREGRGWQGVWQRSCRDSAGIGEAGRLGGIVEPGWTEPEVSTTKAGPVLGKVEEAPERRTRQTCYGWPCCRPGTLGRLLQAMLFGFVHIGGGKRRALPSRALVSQERHGSRQKAGRVWECGPFSSHGGSGAWYVRTTSRGGSSVQSTVK